jgi:hypothetical protein
MIISEYNGSAGKHSDVSYTWNITNDNGMKTILMWGDVKQGHQFGYGKEAFVKKCKLQTCALTDNMRLFPKAHAVIFYVKNVSMRSEFPSDVLIQRDLSAPGYPKRVSRHQIFVFFHVEAPTRHLVNMASLRDIFNLTMTYLVDQDTDIVVHRGISGKVKALPFNQLLDVVKRKTKMVA